MMSDSNLKKLIEFLRDIKEWTDSEIIELLVYIISRS